MIEILFWGVLGLIFFVCWRIVKSQSRLQSCIDKGVIDFDGMTIHIPPTLNDEDRTKIEKEKRIFLAAARGGSLLRLYQRNSPY